MWKLVVLDEASNRRLYRGVLLVGNRRKGQLPPVIETFDPALHGVLMAVGHLDPQSLLVEMASDK